MTGLESIKFRLTVYLVIFVTVMIVGIAGFMTLEDKSFTDALYFMIVTMATVGYGDIHPFTDEGKYLAIFLIIMGVGTFLGVIANATELMLSRREINSRMEKLNMVIGVFFSEVGTALIKLFAGYDPDFVEMQQKLVVTDKWTNDDFNKVSIFLRSYKYRVDMDHVDWPEVKDRLTACRTFLLRLLENPVLLEHGPFTDLLRSMFHLLEELACRDDLSALPLSDRRHLVGDIKRVYLLLVEHWLTYMRYLKDNYPFLFSLAMRTNPFDLDASPIVKDD